jgi:hypothetical protein
MRVMVNLLLVWRYLCQQKVWITNLHMLTEYISWAHARADAIVDRLFPPECRRETYETSRAVRWMLKRRVVGNDMRRRVVHPIPIEGTPCYYRLTREDHILKA